MWLQLLPLVPVFIVLATAGALALSASRRSEAPAPAGSIAGVGLGSSLLASLALWDHSADRTGAIVVDNLALFLNVWLCVLGLLAFVALRAEGRPAPSRRASGAGVLLLLSLAGMMVVAASRDLVCVALALQISWLGSVLLVGTGRRREAATEGAFRLLIHGGLSSAFLWYGVALLYAVTGSTRLSDVAARIAASSLDPNVFVLLALVLLITGVGFLMSAVPFHAWTLDACSAADPAVGGFVTTGLRSVAVAAGLQLLPMFEVLRFDWMPVLSAMAGLSMVVGAILAVGQSSVVRLLASVGIAHAGYLLMGLVAAGPRGRGAVLFSLVAWGAANAVVVGIRPLVCHPARTNDDVGDLVGLGRDRPILAAVMTIGLLSLAGLPPTAGFAARWFVLAAAMQEGLLALSVFGAITSVALAFSCLRLIVQMYRTGEPGPGSRAPVSDRPLAALALVAVVLVVVGLLPEWPLSMVLRAGASAF